MFRSILPFLAVMLLVSPALAREAVPVPRQKPAHGSDKDVAFSIPIPRPNPKRERPSGQTSGAAALGQSGGSCLARLSRLDVQYERLPAISEGRCGAAAPVLLSAVRGVTLDPPATVTCGMAENLHSWVGEVIQPAARKRLKTNVTAIRVAASYVCRLRNNQKSGKLSEHAKANALDMAGFRFAKASDVTVGDGWGLLPAALGLSKGNSFLDDVRKGACSYFTTVLGPGSDGYHGDHFHVDAIQRRGGYRICH